MRNIRPIEGFRPVAGFEHIETWVFDLDNTLYPHHVNLWQQVDERIRDYIAGFLNIPRDEAFRVQKDYYKRYGTSMRGLMTEHGMAPDDFLDYVHQIDHSPLQANAALGRAIEKLAGRKLILTNGTRRHAQAVLERLALTHHFDDVFDIAAAALEPSPRRRPMRGFSQPMRSIRRAAMFEDLARNPRCAPTGHDHRAGSAGEHLRGRAETGARRPRRPTPTVTDDLAGFLERWPRRE